MVIPRSAPSHENRFRDVRDGPVYIRHRKHCGIAAILAIP
jgi:hypothetical protein